MKNTMRMLALALAAVAVCNLQAGLDEDALAAANILKTTSYTKSTGAWTDIADRANKDKAFAAKLFAHGALAGLTRRKLYSEEEYKEFEETAQAAIAKRKADMRLAKEVRDITTVPSEAQVIEQAAMEKAAEATMLGRMKNRMNSMGKWAMDNKLKVLLSALALAAAARGGYGAWNDNPANFEDADDSMTRGYGRYADPAFYGAHGRKAFDDWYSPADATPEAAAADDDEAAE